jgi:hypothetical protein
MDLEKKKNSRWKDERSKQSPERILQLIFRRRQLRERAKSRRETVVRSVDRTQTIQPCTNTTPQASPCKLKGTQIRCRNNFRFINLTLSKLRSKIAPSIIYGDGFVFGGKERCRVGKTFDCYNANYNDTMAAINKGKQMLRSQLMMGNDRTYAVLDRPVFAVARNGNSENSPAFLAIHVSHLENVVIDETSVSGQWLLEKPDIGCSLPSCELSSKYLSKFLNLTGTSGIPLHKLFPDKSRTPKATLKKGQTNFDNGFMIGAMPNNSKSWTCDANGCRLPLDQFHAVRGSMGVIGGKAHLRAEELLSPCVPIADRLFNAWPVKLKTIPYSAKQAFDGSRRLSYTTVLLTVGNEDRDASVGDAINSHGLDSYLLDKAGKYIHVDRLNTTNSPCVVITLGAYDGFRFCFPTLNTEIRAPSGTAIIGTFDSLLHAVSSGTGVRLSLVYCQHEEIVTGQKTNKSTPDRLMTGARKSMSHKKGKTPIIQCLSNHDFK